MVSYLLFYLQIIVWLSNEMIWLLLQVVLILVYCCICFIVCCVNDRDQVLPFSSFSIPVVVFFLAFLNNGRSSSYFVNFLITFMFFATREYSTIDYYYSIIFVLRSFCTCHHFTGKLSLFGILEFTLDAWNLRQYI